MNSLGLNNAELKNLLLEARQMIVVERMQWANKSKVHIYKGKKTFRFDSNTVIDRTARGVYQHSQMQEAIKAMKDFARSIFGDAETADQHGTETGKSLSERLHELQMGQQEAPLSCQESTKPAKAFTLRQVRIIFTGVTKAKQKGKPAYELTFPRMENRIRFGSFFVVDWPLLQACLRAFAPNSNCQPSDWLKAETGTNEGTDPTGHAFQTGSLVSVCRPEICKKGLCHHPSSREPPWSSYTPRGSGMRRSGPTKARQSPRRPSTSIVRPECTERHRDRRRQSQPPFWSRLLS